jgi:trehalose 6-phosphate synthase/phosphatase
MPTAAEHAPPTTRLVNVSNRLPVTLGKSPDDIRMSSGGLVAALGGLGKESFDQLWIGWPGSDVAEGADRDRVQARLRDEFGCEPVWIPPQQAAGHYEGFANASVWPLLHYMTDRFRYDASWWDDYRAVNERFAERVLAATSDDDVIWVHDYQLMLLPKLLKQARPRSRVGFFLHTPFPSYEIIRCHPNASALVEGVLHADLAGFHTFGYLRHFRSSALRLLGVEAEITSLWHGGRECLLGVYPIGIDARRFDEQTRTPEHQKQVERFRGAFGTKRLVVSVERLDYTKGILQRLDAIDLLLHELDDEQRNRLKFVFVSVPSRENVEEYRELREEVERRVGRTNGEHATLENSPVHFIHGSVQFAELCALYAMSEVAIVTPLMDGMNLVAKEYVACQSPDAEGGPGVLVLSEFAGAAEELSTALIVNPYDAAGVARAVKAALEMPATERRRRVEPMLRRIREYDAQAWARSFVDDLASQPVDPPIGAAGDEGSRSAAQVELRDAIASATPQRRVAMFLDYDGTLREIVANPDAASPTPELRALLGRLDRLAAAARVDVCVVSGRVATDLDRFLGEFTSIGRIAEHGAALRRPRREAWERLDEGVDYAWRDDLLPLLRLFERGTPGSWVEVKRTGLVWHYRNADPEFGAWRAKGLIDELSSLTANAPVEVRQGRKIVEIVAAHLNKGAAVTRLVSDAGGYARLLIAGDDVTDESMFALAAADAITARIGPGDTEAKLRFRDPAAFRGWLEGVLRHFD